MRLPLGDREIVPLANKGIEWSPGTVGQGRIRGFRRRDFQHVGCGIKAVLIGDPGEFSRKGRDILSCCLTFLTHDKTPKKVPERVERYNRFDGGLCEPAHTGG